MPFHSFFLSMTYTHVTSSHTHTHIHTHTLISPSHTPIYNFIIFLAAYLPEDKEYSVRLFETSLSLQSSNQPVLTAAVLRAADALFQSPQYSLAPTETAACLRILASTKLVTKDMESHTYRHLAMGSAMVKLHHQGAFSDDPALFRTVAQALMQVSIRVT